jgi:hypothetical protein
VGLLKAGKRVEALQIYFLTFCINLKLRQWKFLLGFPIILLKNATRL